MAIAQAVLRGRMHQWWVLGTVTIGLFAQGVHSGVNVALPYMASELGADLAAIQWVVVAVYLASSIVLLPMGRVADVFGRKRLYLLGLGVFLMGSGMAGVSHNLPMLLAARVLQGIAQAMILVNTMAMVVSVFGDVHRGKALGFYGAIASGSGLVWPVLAGWLVGAFGWRAVFFSSVPLAALAIMTALAVLDEARFKRESGSRGVRGFDWVGSGLSATLVFLILLVATDGHRLGWSSPSILAASASTFVLAGLFGWWELRSPSPMLDLRLFTRRLFTLGLSGRVIGIGATAPVNFLMPFYLTAVLGLDAKEVGMVLVPGALCTMLIQPLSGRLADMFGVRWFTGPGLATAGGGLLVLAFLHRESSIVVVLVGLVLQGAGMGMFIAPNSSWILGSVEQSRHGVASAFISLSRNVPSSLGIALAIAVVTTVMTSMGHSGALRPLTQHTDAGVVQAFVQGQRISYFLLGGLALSGTLLYVLKGPRREAASGNV